MNNSSAIILKFSISQGSVATQLRWDGTLYNSYIVCFLRNLPVKKWKSIIGLYLPKLYCFLDTVYINIVLWSAHCRPTPSHGVSYTLWCKNSRSFVPEYLTSMQNNLAKCRIAILSCHFSWRRLHSSAVCAKHEQSLAAGAMYSCVGTLQCARTCPPSKMHLPVWFLGPIWVSPQTASRSIRLFL